MRRVVQPRLQDVELLQVMQPGEWQTPLELGGSSNSHHSRTLQRLAGLKLVELQERKGEDAYKGRGAHRYKRTSEGDRLLNVFNAAPWVHFDSIWTTFIVERAEVDDGCD